MPANPNPTLEGTGRTGGRRTPGWAPFARLAGQYDAWFDSAEGRRIFDVETACIRSLLADSPRPWLEVGVGTGRFAEALEIDEGLDPCPAVLRYAERRGIRTRCGSAEALPYENGSFGTAMLIVTLCFLDDPVRAFAECRRVLKEDGKVLVGLVPKDSPWGKAYARQGAEGHPFYSAARFYTTRGIIALARRAGFELDQAASCLPETPGQTVDARRAACDGIVKNAGFVALRFGISTKAERSARERSVEATAVKAWILTSENMDDIRGVTLEERARLVLLTLGKTADEIHRAYRKMAVRHHPDRTGGNTLRFQLINEAYEILTQGAIPRKPLLADDALLVRIIGRKVETLIDKQKAWEEYQRWHRAHFYEVGVV